MSLGVGREIKTPHNRRPALSVCGGNLREMKPLCLGTGPGALTWHAVQLVYEAVLHQLGQSKALNPKTRMTLVLSSSTHLWFCINTVFPLLTQTKKFLKNIIWCFFSPLGIKQVIKICLLNIKCGYIHKLAVKSQIPPNNFFLMSAAQLVSRL